MTKLLNKVIKRAEELPAEKQDMVAAAILAEMDMEDKWERLFEQTTGRQWQKMVNQARQSVDQEGAISSQEFYNRIETA
jgi:hypothetical protein